MLISDFNYILPEGSIAQFPPEIRGTSRLLVLNRKTGEITHRKYADLADYLERGDVLVLNDTKVIRARLLPVNEAGKQIEIFLLEQHGESADPHNHSVIYRGKLLANELLHLDHAVIEIKKINDDGTAHIYSESDLNALSETKGEVPLPPYMKRDATSQDTERYQTVFAAHSGSVAAPTASLNMTEELIARIKAKGVTICYLTLHVGLGTFAPIRTDDITQHDMHSEYFSIPKETITAIRNARSQGSAVVAIGTTVTRALEFAHKEVIGSPVIENCRGEAKIFIYPGYEFKVINKLVTNFHAPKSTVLMLTAAFAGWEHLKSAYEEALKEEYGFLSYGDSMLITE